MIRVIYVAWSDWSGWFRVVQVVRGARTISLDDIHSENIYDGHALDHQVIENYCCKRSLLS